MGPGHEGAQSLLAASYCYNQSPGLPLLPPWPPTVYSFQRHQWTPVNIESGHIPPPLRSFHSTHLTGWKSHTPPRGLHILPSRLRPHLLTPCLLLTPSSLGAFSRGQPQSPCIGCVLCHQVIALPPPPSLRSSLGQPSSLPCPSS